MSFRHRRLAKLLLASLTTILTLGIVEVAFRFSDTRGVFHGPLEVTQLVRPSGPKKKAPHGSVPNSILRIRYPSDPRGYFDPGHIMDHRYNSVGWRDGELETRRSGNTYRILALGDSYLFGQGVRPEHICLTRLKDLLSNEMTDIEFETINTGQPGFNTANERDLLREVGLEYDPDLVIVHFCLNDVETDLTRTSPKVEFYGEYVSLYNTPDTLSRYSYLWSWSRQRLLKQFVAQRYIRDCVASFSPESESWKTCRDALRDIRDLCAKRNIKFLVVVFPFFHRLDGNYPFQPIHDVVRTYCESLEVPVLDLRDAYRAYHGPELWVHPNDQHPNEVAHQVAAHAIATHLIEKKSEWFGNTFDSESIQPASSISEKTTP